MQSASIPVIIFSNLSGYLTLNTNFFNLLRCTLGEVILVLLAN